MAGGHRAALRPESRAMKGIDRNKQNERNSHRAGPEASTADRQGWPRGLPFELAGGHHQTLFNFGNAMPWTYSHGNNLNRRRCSRFNQAAVQWRM